MKMRSLKQIPTSEIERRTGRISKAVILLFIFAIAIFAATARSADVGNDIKISFAVISDVHLNTNRDNVKGRMLKHSEDLLGDAVRQINGIPDIAFVVFTGDFIDSPTEANVLRFTEIANSLNAPWFWAVGNHDIGPGGLTREKLMQLLNENTDSYKQETTHYSFRVADWMFVVLDGASDTEVTAAGNFNSENMLLLKTISENYDASDVFVFQHFPVEYPFSSKSHKVINQQEYFRIMDSHPNIRAVFSGHYHTTDITERNGAYHISTPALIEYPCAFRIVTLEKAAAGTVMTTEFLQTGLKDVSDSSLKRNPSRKGHEGKEADRSVTVLFE